MKTAGAISLRVTTCIVALYISLMLTWPSSATEQPGDGSLVIGAFNVRTFGVSKVGKGHVVDILIKILSRYDLVLIQEIRDVSGTAIQLLLDSLNDEVGGQYEMVLSERLGRSSSKEQYAFFYKPSKLTLLWSYVYNDVARDVFEREPFIAYFESPTTAIDRFGAIGVHIKPTDAVRELNRLVEVYDDFADHSNQKNAIIMGDLNADCSYVSDSDLSNLTLRTDERFTWIISDDEDTTVSKSICAYDRFVIAGDELNENLVPNKTRTQDFDKAYDLDVETAKDVSDHYPIEMVIRGNVLPIVHTTGSSSGVSCSVSYRAAVWMCLLVIAQREDIPQCIQHVLGAITTYADQCTHEWYNMYVNYPTI